MKFLVDHNVGCGVAQALQADGHDAITKFFLPVAAPPEEINTALVISPEYGILSVVRIHGIPCFREWF
jgi:hypothetical protein